MPRNANQSKSTNYSLNFGGGTDYVSIGSVPNLFIGSWSISFWFKAPSIGNTNGTIISRYRSSNFTGDLEISSTSGQLYVETGGPSNAFPSTGAGAGNNQIRTTSTSLDDGNWHHIAFSLDYTSGTSTRSLYVDGSLDVSDSTTTPAEWVSQTENLLFGVLLTPANSQFNGFISDVSIFDYTISSSQVTTLYGSSSNGIGNPMSLSPKPAAYYPLGTSAWNGNFLAENNAIGDYVFDFSGNKTVDLSQNLNLGSQSTISYWVKSTNNIGNYIQNNGGNLINTGPYSGDEYYTFKPNNSVGGAGMNSSNINTYVLSTNWVHWTVVRNGTGCELYANGQFMKTATVANWSGYDTIVSGLGKNASGIVGDASNFLFWNTNLSSTEVETLYNYGSPIQTLASIPQSSNLKAWYKLDATEIYNSSSTEWEISDATAAIKLSTLQNAPGSSAYRVSDSSGVINFPSQSTGTLKMSTSIWFYAPSSISSGQNLALMYAGPQSRLFLGFSGSNQLRCIVTNGGWMIGNYVTMGQWNQFTATIDVVSSTRTVKFYINGQPAGTANQNGGAPTSATDGITVSAYGYAAYSEQVLSSNSVFWENVILTDAEVLSHYNSFSVSNGVPTVQPVLSNFPQSSSISGWYKLDGNPKDSSGNSRDATYSGDNNVMTGPGVSNANGQSTGMSQTNLVQSDLLTTTSYSSYALQFDGLLDKIDCGVSPFDETTGDITISAWVKRTAAAASYAPIVSATQGVSGATTQFSFQFYGNSLSLFWKGLGGTDLEIVPTSAFTVANDVWYLINFVRTGTTGRFYVNGNFIHLSTKTYNDLYSTGIPNLSIGAWWFSSNAGVAGSISNVALWNTSLSAVELREVYNEGRPSNLNNFSGTAPIHWWQLGENSSFDGNNWIVADEKGTNNGTSTGMPVGALVNGVGTTANGVSSGMPEGNLIGDAPYSTANALSTNMAVTARVTGSGNTP